MCIFPKGRGKKGGHDLGQKVSHVSHEVVHLLRTWEKVTAIIIINNVC